MMPADGHFPIAIGKGNHKTAEIGQTPQHSRLINMFGVKQIYIDVHKMDCYIVGCKQPRYDETRKEMKNTLAKSGRAEDSMEKNIPELQNWLDAIARFQEQIARKKACVEELHQAERDSVDPRRLISAPSARCQGLTTT